MSRIAQATPPYFTDSNGTRSQGRWLVESINVIEAKAGDHCTIRVVFEAAAADDSATTELIADSEEWTLTWQPYTVSPYEFCSNEHHEPRIISPSDEMDRDWQMTACRDNIEQYRLWAGKAVVATQGGVDYTAYAWTPNPKQTNACYPTRYAMSDTEALVWEKVQLGRQCVYHSPVLSYTRDYNCLSANLSGTFDPPDTNGKVGSDLDIASENLPEGCPFTLDNFLEGGEIKDWCWIKTGDTVQSVGKVGENNRVYRRTETWMGVSNYDENFYGSTDFNHANENGVTKGRWYKGCL